MKCIKASIRSIQSYIPAAKLTNDELAAEYPEWSVDKIYGKTGIAARGVSGPNECSSDLGVEAAKKLFSRGICGPGDINFLIFCTQSPDYFLPATACIVQRRLGLATTCGAIDINQGCSGFIYGLSLAKGLIEAGIVGNVLLITAETYTKFINPRDRSVRTIFGDGAAATLVSKTEDGRENIGPFFLGTDGEGSEELIVPAGGMRRPLDTDAVVEYEDKMGNIRSDRDLYMNGTEIFNFTLRSVPKLVGELLEKASFTLDEIDYFIFHQANRFMLETLRKKIGIPPGKFCINMEMSGNTVSSTIPIAMEVAYNEKAFKAGDRLMLVGFGVGYSWGGVCVELDESYIIGD